jgi:hypothetical protein
MAKKSNLLFFVTEEHTKEGYFIAMEILMNCCVARVQICATCSVNGLGRENETYLTFVRINFSTELEAQLCGVR